MTHIKPSDNIFKVLSKCFSLLLSSLSVKTVIVNTQTGSSIHYFLLLQTTLIQRYKELKMYSLVTLAVRMDWQWPPYHQQDILKQQLFHGKQPDQAVLCLLLV